MAVSETLSIDSSKCQLSLRALPSCHLRIVTVVSAQANPGIPPERLVSVHVEGKNAEGVTGSSDFFNLASDPGDLSRHACLWWPDGGRGS